MNLLRTLVILGTGVLAISAACTSGPAMAQQARPPGSSAPPNPVASGSMGGGGMGRLAADPKALNAPRTIAPYFVPVSAAMKAPDAEGFLQRWLLLEPINKPNRSNNLFVGSYVRSAFNTQYFPDQFTRGMPSIPPGSMAAGISESPE